MRFYLHIMQISAFLRVKTHVLHTHLHTKTAKLRFLHAKLQFLHLNVHVLPAHFGQKVG